MIYVADWYGGLFLLEYSYPLKILDGGDVLPIKHDLSLKQNHPNPFNPVTEIEFETPAEGKAILTVYSVRGRKITTLVNEELEAGTHRLIWDGRDVEGGRVSAGVYFYQLAFVGKNGVRSDSILRKLVILP
jgi:flagellar hook assembly protein FlgD